ncbi:MAG: hypothetical protein AAF086_03055 [Planctomycetota bacterium]
MKIIVGLIIVFMMGAAVWLHAATDQSDAAPRLVGLDFPDYLKYHGFGGRQLEITLPTPVSEQNLPWLGFKLYYIDEQDTLQSGPNRLVRSPPVQLIRRGGVWRGQQEITLAFDVQNADKPEMAFEVLCDGYPSIRGITAWPTDSLASGFTLDEPLDTEIVWDQPIEVFRLGISKLDNPDGSATSGWGDRVFYLVFRDRPFSD